METWGAEGGTYNVKFHGGYGGYSISNIKLNKGESLYINVGGTADITSLGDNQKIAGGNNGDGKGSNNEFDSRRIAGGVEGGNFYGGGVHYTTSAGALDI